MSPSAGAFHPVFQSPDRFQILLDLSLILATETIFKATALIHQQIKNAGLALEPGTHLFNTISSIRLEKPVEDLLRLIHGWNRPSWATMRKGLAPSIRTRTALGTQHHGGKSSLMPVNVGSDLINRDAIRLLAAYHVRARGKDIP